MDLRKLQSDVDPKRSYEVFEILRNDTTLFNSWTKFDIQKLCENIKIISFGRNATIVQKNEPMEYFGIVVGGKLLIKQDSRVIGHLGAGDVLGYMAYMDFNGAKVSPFDIVADLEGYLAVFRFDEFKMLSKKEPQLSYKITEMLGKKALNTVSLQYTGEDVYSPYKLKGPGSAINTKRVRDAIETCPEFAEFFERFDVRDRKNLTKYFEFIEFDKEQRIVYDGKKTDDLILLVKGELISFRLDKPVVYYKPGAVIGNKEFLFELTWQENILGKVKGVLLKLGRQTYQEMIQGSNATANNLYKALIWYQSKEIKTRYQDRSMFEKVQGKNVKNPLNDFVEFEVTKHMDFLNEQEKKIPNSRPMMKEFLLRKECLPLYIHDIHQTLFANEQAANADEKRKKQASNAMGCVFLRERLENQIAEQKSKKGKGRLAPKGKPGPDGKKSDDKAPDDDYEDLKNNYLLLENENEELRAKISELLEETKGYRQDIQSMKEVNTTASTKINKTLIHRELISKDFRNQDPSTFLTRNYNSSFSTFGDVLKEQYTVSNKAKRVAKYAYRWLAIVRTKKKQQLVL